MPVHLVRFRPHPIALGILASAVMSAAQADELPPLQIQARALGDTPNVEVITPADIDTRIPADAGEALREVNGVSASRMSQHGVDPIIRGQSATQINVLLDGSYIHGGCPNRMDPPTSFASLNTYDRVVVEKGVQSVQHGMGGSGGTVLFERDSAKRAATAGVQGQAGVITSSNGVDGAVYADGLFSNGKAYLRAFGEYLDASSYKDGAGRTVPSATSKLAGGVVAGYRFNDNAGIEGTIEASRQDDTLYAGADMDSPKDDMDAYRLKYWQQNMGGSIDGVKAEVWHAKVEHLMDNYSLRPNSNPAMYRAAPSEVTTSGARLTLTSKPTSNLKLDYGLDAQKVEREGWVMNPANPANKLFWLWPEAELSSVGGFIEGLYGISPHQRLKAGLRVDNVNANINNNLSNTIATHPMVPLNIREEAKKDQDNTAIGGLLRYEHDLSKNLTAFVGISRSVRHPDATERYVLKPSPTGISWLGNPALDTEVHHQLDLGLSGKGQGIKWEAVLFYDNVNDYVLRDINNGRIKGVANNATIYRNVDATLFGAELAGQWMFAPGWHAYGALAYVNAQNDTDGRSIAQTPPLNGRIGADYSAANWHVGGRVRFAAQQHEIDKASGLDTIQTPEYAVLDLYGGYAFSRTIQLKLGIDNVFDRLYAEHVNRAYAGLFGNPNDRIYEPGRIVWARLDTRF
ncbi:MAG: TonB-dependent copper receptor [Gammaproteobacteria bacterium]|nr:TonB-dependent copper receptor [Gammaproteobacteria bacterium]